MCACACMCPHASVCVCVCACVCVCVCIYVYVCMYAYVCMIVCLCLACLCMCLTPSASMTDSYDTLVHFQDCIPPGSDFNNARTENIMLGLASCSALSLSKGTCFGRFWLLWLSCLQGHWHHIRHRFATPCKLRQHTHLQPLRSRCVPKRHQKHSCRKTAHFASTQTASTNSTEASSLD